MVSRVLVDISDPNQRRWTSDQVVKFINEGVRQLADKGAFTLVDYQVPTAGKAYFQTFAEPKRILSVAYNGSKLKQILRDGVGYALSELASVPCGYVAMPDGIRVSPPVASAGTALTFVSAVSITEAEGFQIQGDTHNVALDSTTYKHFHDYDGVCNSALTAANNMRIEYSYFPRDLESTDSCPSRYVDALVIYATWRCFNLSNVAEEVTRAQVLLGQWEIMKRQLLGDKRPATIGTEMGMVVQ
jgi:hypothetical protein